MNRCRSVFELTNKRNAPIKRKIENGTKNELLDFKTDFTSRIYFFHNDVN